MGRSRNAKHHPAWNPQCTQWFRAEEFPLLCLKPKVMPRFSLGAVGEAKRGGRCRTDGSIRVLSCQMRHTIAAIRPRCVALCVEPPLGVRPTLPAARGSPQLAASAESLVTGDEERSSNRRVTCLLHIISDVTRVRHAQGTTLSILRAFIVLLLYKQRCFSCLARPVWGTIGRCRAEAFCPRDKCSVRCRPMKQRGKIYRNF